ncbi:hypothetical protein [Novipirellula artificiosorum]|uniref:Uncharacterized protein n=1 Tax=Novipirellula artificiosorum TaxID=2528016 RepID=A0A5C6DST0_9BACT|nr:hypothetical protein [Novipirellula artificiosorum]TWU39712.1 hypothetical protein Poly41_25680 [Novipirellula artificiosorum]
MRTLHHIGIPTDRVIEGMAYLEEAGVHVSDPDQSPNRIEWLRFEDQSGMPEMLKTMPHIAYRVDDLAAELKDAEMLLDPFTPMEGVTVAFVIEEGAPIEFLQIEESNS